MRMIHWGLLASLLLCGCEETGVKPQEEVGAAKQTPPGPPPTPVLGQADLPYPRGGRVEVDQSDDQVRLKERVKAKVGVGSKGRDLEDERMVKTIVTPAIALFRTRERVVFDIQIPKAMQRYEALNGKKPATQEEFFEQIIEQYRIPLPELPKGERYVYDPEKAQLMVERPVR